MFKNKIIKRGIAMCSLSLLIMILIAWITSVYSTEISVLLTIFVINNIGLVIGLLIVWNYVSIGYKAKQILEDWFDKTK